MVYQNAGRQIQLLRIQHRLTQKELAEKINSSQNYISEVETGKKQPSIDYYVAVANFFNVSLDHLFSDSIKMKKNIIIDNVVLNVNVKRKCTKRASENVQFRRVAYSVTFIKGKQAALLPLTNIPSYAFV